MRESAGEITCIEGQGEVISVNSDISVDAGVSNSFEVTSGDLNKT